MRVFAIGDPHLALGTPGKSMDRFGDHWVNHPDRIAAACRDRVGEEDLLIVPGDISWAIRLDAAAPDLAWLGDLPGHKVICRGNHDYWWSSNGKVRMALPPSVSAVNGDVVRHGDFVLAGTRLWDVPGVSFRAAIDWRGEEGESISAPTKIKSDEQRAQDEKIYRRELARLERSLNLLREERAEQPGRAGILLLHYPPTDLELRDTEVTELIERYPVEHVVFGHLHALRDDLEQPLFGVRNGVHYHLTSADVIHFAPIEIPIG